MPLVECLNCGETRQARRDDLHRIHLGDCCPRCGYVGWASATDLNETTRRALRDRPLARRRQLTVALTT
ncbi:MAG TPA: hypothetical protein VFI37_11935 [Gaiellaceae bacterium]|jgi:hypothetical protein|nr:hypothetical protein [Gaiellaceae bacterium]